MAKAFTERKIVFRPNVRHWRECSDSGICLSVDNLLADCRTSHTSLRQASPTIMCGAQSRWQSQSFSRCMPQLTVAPWSEGRLSPACALQVILAHIGAREHTSFLNPPELASIPGVWHAHCLSRPAQQTE